MEIYYHQEQNCYWSLEDFKERYEYEKAVTGEQNRDFEDWKVHFIKTNGFKKTDLNMKQKEFIEMLKEMDSNNEIETSELCPYCDMESSMKHMVDKCEHCGEVILACSMCDTHIMDCAKCPFSHNLT